MAELSETLMCTNSIWHILHALVKQACVMGQAFSVNLYAQIITQYVLISSYILVCFFLVIIIVYICLFLYYLQQFDKNIYLFMCNMKYLLLS